MTMRTIMVLFTFIASDCQAADKLADFFVQKKIPAKEQVKLSKCFSEYQQKNPKLDYKNCSFNLVHITGKYNNRFDMIARKLPFPAGEQCSLNYKEGFPLKEGGYELKAADPKKPPLSIERYPAKGSPYVMIAKSNQTLAERFLMTQDVLTFEAFSYGAKREPDPNEDDWKQLVKFWGTAERNWPRVGWSMRGWNSPSVIKVVYAEKAPYEFDSFEIQCLLKKTKPIVKSTAAKPASCAPKAFPPDSVMKESLNAMKQRMTFVLSSDQRTITITPTEKQKQNGAKIRIIDSSNTVVKSFSLLPGQSNSALDLKELPAGKYGIEVESQGLKVLQKVTLR